MILSPILVFYINFAAKFRERSGSSRLVSNAINITTDTHSTAILPLLATLKEIKYFARKPIYFFQKTQFFNVLRTVNISVSLIVAILAVSTLSAMSAFKQFCTLRFLHSLHFFAFLAFLAFLDSLHSLYLVHFLHLLFFCILCNH